MLNNSIKNNIFIIKNGFDIKKTNKFPFFFKNLSTLDSISLNKRICFVGNSKHNFCRTTRKFSCLISGKFGAKISYFYLNRFVFFKKLSFNKLNLFSKKS